MTTRRPPKKLSRRALLLISMLFVGSGLIRLFDGTGLAIALAFEAFADVSKTVESGSELTCGSEAEVEAVLTTLRQKSEEMANREARIAGRMQALRLAEEEIKRNLALLEETEQELAKTMASADGAAESDIDRLTKVYESMKPKDASKLFEQMDPTFSAGFLARMAPEKAALVMAGMEPRTAYTVSAVLAGRNTGIPRE